MSGYLVFGDWSGHRKIPVDVIGEGPDGVEIKTLERTFLPGYGILKVGQSAVVPKTIVQADVH